MNICDNSLLRAEAFLNSADKAATRFHDAHISAQSEFTLAKLEWTQEAVSGQTWMQRCAHIIPKVSQRKIDDVVAGRFPKIAQDGGELSPAEYEERLKSLAADHGLPYRTPEQRAEYGARLMEAMAAGRRRQAQSAVEAREAARASARNGCAQIETETKAEYDAKRRSEAEVIRVSSGGAPAQRRTYVAKVEVDHADEARDNLLLLVISKLRPLSVADLNEVNDLIDALTYPLRKQSQ